MACGDFNKAVSLRAFLLASFFFSDLILINNVCVWFLMIYKLKCFHYWKKHRINNNAHISHWPKIDLKGFDSLSSSELSCVKPPVFFYFLFLNKRLVFMEVFLISWVVSFCFSLLPLQCTWWETSANLRDIKGNIPIYSTFKFGLWTWSSQCAEVTFSSFIKPVNNLSRNEMSTMLYFFVLATHF